MPIVFGEPVAGVVDDDGMTEQKVALSLVKVVLRIIYLPHHDSFMKGTTCKTYSHLSSGRFTSCLLGSCHLVSLVALCVDVASIVAEVVSLLLAAAAAAAEIMCRSVRTTQAQSRRVLSDNFGVEQVESSSIQQHYEVFSRVKYWRSSCATKKKADEMTVHRQAETLFLLKLMIEFAPFSFQFMGVCLCVCSNKSLKIYIKLFLMNPS